MQRNCSQMLITGLLPLLEDNDDLPDKPFNALLEYLRSYA